MATETGSLALPDETNSGDAPLSFPVRESTLFIARNLTSLDLQQGAQLATKIVEEMGPDASYMDWLVKEKSLPDHRDEIDGEKALGQATFLAEESSFAPISKVAMNFPLLQEAVLERQKREAREAKNHIVTLTKAVAPYTKVLSDSDTNVSWNTTSFENRFWGIPYAFPPTEEERIEADELALYLRDSAGIILEARGKVKKPGFIRREENGRIPFFNPANEEKIEKLDTSRYRITEESIPLESGGTVDILIGSIGRKPPRESSLMVIKIPSLDDCDHSRYRGFLVLPRGQQAELWSRPYYMSGLGPKQANYDEFARVATVEDITIFKSLVDHLTSQQK